MINRKSKTISQLLNNMLFFNFNFKIELSICGHLLTSLAFGAKDWTKNVKITRNMN